MKIRKKEFFFALFLAITVFIIIMILLEIPKIERDLKNNVKNDLLRTISSIVDNFDHKLQVCVSQHHGQTLNSILEQNPVLRSDLESDLSMITYDDIKYSYVLYRDNENIFRFMLDGATQDKAEFGRKFDIEDQKWQRAYETGQPQLITQEKLYTLWFTYLKPIVVDNKVQGIIAIDFSLEGQKHITEIVEPLHKYVWIFLALLGIGILLSAVQFLLYRLSQKRVYLDPLTGLYNRNFFNDIISTIDYQKYAIAMMDLDKFKIINDTYGHEIGDDVLKKVSNVLKSSIREYDKLIRYGGEEFLLYLSMRDLEQTALMEILNRIRQNVESIEIKAGLITIHPTISIGLNSYTSHFKSEFDAISMADKMLYTAKRTGRNKISSFIPSHKGAEHSIHMLNVHHVKEAIEEKRIFCEYQPVVHLGSNQIVGYEALVRIRDRDGKISYPGMFLPNIVHSNIYKELTLMILQICFQKLRDEQCSISVNLNITDILDDDIYTTIKRHLELIKEDAAFLTFELLEEEQITSLDTLKERIQSLHSLGSKISLDDFGSGYSNFNHIFTLDVDIIKIDGSLIKDIDTSDISYKLVESIIAFARASDKIVVAEYIHSSKVLEIVKELGIIYGQGFYLGKPSETLSTKPDYCP
ncbi:MAG: EAL domain-containing protein [Sulfuricurvum sp.]|uniref:EAL domain-containing protein n=1 Tax=Sulfuricurvum sp. TaxID=2025608 RepID=UPI00262B9ABF|nr:EAL domain-containing protein [Sulfuricurvum sp.]MDD2950478.1 EAL domain-containing protein [Sulfuricurvum sp.]MDD5118241.1 EAL domain-containing protein [Sulfuricurvum sp.]